MQNQKAAAILMSEGLKDIPVIILTASQGAVTEEGLTLAHADSRITKPFEPEELFRTIEKFLK